MNFTIMVRDFRHTKEGGGESAHSESRICLHKLFQTSNKNILVTFRFGGGHFLSHYLEALTRLRPPNMPNVKNIPLLRCQEGREEHNKQPGTRFRSLPKLPILQAPRNPCN